MTEESGVRENNTNGVYKLQLYVTGATPNSSRAIENLKKLCEIHL